MPMGFKDRGRDSDGALRWDAYITQGDDLSGVLTGEDDGVALDFTGGTAILAVVDDDGDAVLTFSSAAVPATIAISGGTLTLTQTDTTTAALTPGRYQYDLQVTVGGITTTYMRGTFDVIAEA